MAPFIFLHTIGRYNKVNLSDILNIEANKNYSKIITLQGTYLTLTMVKLMEAALPSDHFLRIHRSFLVLLKHVTALDRHTVYLSGRQLPLGDSYRPALEAFVLFVSNTKPRNYAKSTRSGSHAL